MLFQIKQGRRSRRNVPVGRTRRRECDRRHRGSTRRRRLGRFSVRTVAPLGLATASALAIVVAAAAVGLGSANAGVSIPQSPSTPPVPSAASAGTSDPLVDGRDYSFLSHVNGSPVHWSCGTPIFLDLRVPSPAGAAAALSRSVGLLRDASGLDLRVGKPPPGDGAITIRYAPAGTVSGDLSLDAGPELGVGGPTWSERDGVIRSGEVLIRDDTPTTDPLSPTGRRVLLHEIGHALGLGHSADGVPEVMSPTTGDGDSDQLGRGDLAALARVGCRQ